MRVAAVLYCWALSDILAISSSILTELASRGRSPARHFFQSPRHPLKAVPLRADVVVMCRDQGDRELALLGVRQRLPEVQIRGAIFGRFFIGDVGGDHLLASPAQVQRRSNSRMVRSKMVMVRTLKKFCPLLCNLCTVAHAR